MGLILKKSIHSQLYYCNPNKIDYRIFYSLVQYVLVIYKFAISKLHSLVKLFIVIKL